MSNLNPYEPPETLPEQESRPSDPLLSNRLLFGPPRLLGVNLVILGIFGLLTLILALFGSI